MNRYRVRARRSGAACILDRCTGETFFWRPNVDLVRSVCRDLNTSVQRTWGERWIYDPRAPWPPTLEGYPERLRDPERRAG